MKGKGRFCTSLLKHATGNSDFPCIPVCSTLCLVLLQEIHQDLPRFTPWKQEATQYPQHSLGHPQF